MVYKVLRRRIKGEGEGIRMERGGIGITVEGGKREGERGGEDG